MRNDLLFQVLLLGAGTSGDSISLKTHSIRIISTFQTYFIFSIHD